MFYKQVTAYRRSHLVPWQPLPPGVPDRRPPLTAASPMLDHLRASIATGNAILVIGAGVTANATGGREWGTWRGLIRNGLTRVVQLTDKEADWLEHQEWLLEGDVHDLIGVAQQVETRLRRAGDFERWLRDLVGSLVADQTGVYDTLTKSRAPIVTTNYDTLVEQATGRGGRSWDDRFNLGEWLHRSAQKREVLHLHGVYDDPDSVVLGNTSYQSLLLDRQAQFVQKVLAATSDLVFLGCGSTMEDPNLGALLEWVAQDRSGRQHFRLCLDSEIGPIRAAAARGSRIAAIPYGPSHGDLPGFVARHLCHPEETLTPKMRALVTAYHALVDEVYEGPQRWWAKDAIVRDMRAEAAAAPLDLDALNFLGGDGYKVLALASMLNAPSDAYDERIDRMCDGRLPVNAAFKACDYVGDRIRAGAAPPSRVLLRSILDKVDRMWPRQDDLREWLNNKRAELAAMT